ncbi:MAG TPA: hypothetical protein EYQ20_12415, partial [candidate division Zixibacteria bacterium]|nr:hypothetical protein [candidate division Zixibacteria bacterium]
MAPPYPFRRPALFLPSPCRMAVGSADDQYLTDGTVNFNRTSTYLNNTGFSKKDWTSTIVDGDIVGMAFDADTGEVNFYKNGIWDDVGQTLPVEALTNGALFSVVSQGGYPSNCTVNFGQRTWSFDPPEGYLALNSQ